MGLHEKTTLQYKKYKFEWTMNTIPYNIGIK